MTRIKRGKITCKKRRKRIQYVKGFRGAWSTLSRPAIQGVIRSFNFSYKHRKRKSGFFRQLSIVRSNALIRAYGIPFTYSTVKPILRSFNCKLNQTTLNQLGTRDSKTFVKLIKLCSY